MIKKIVVILLWCSAALMLFVSCSGIPGGTTVNMSTSGSSTEVHMGSQTFVQSTMTISKGSSLTLVDDVGVLHIIANGTWDNSIAKPMKETNAPEVNVHLTGNDKQVIGPFTTAGTYHLYCTVHPGMNLTVIVQ
jgi:plastocyanin